MRNKIFMLILLHSLVMLPCYPQILDSIEVEGYMLIEHEIRSIDNPKYEKRGDSTFINLPTCSLNNSSDFYFLPYTQIKSGKELMDSIESKHLFEKNIIYTACYFPRVPYRLNAIIKSIDFKQIPCNLPKFDKVLYKFPNSYYSIYYEVYYVKAMFLTMTIDNIDKQTIPNARRYMRRIQYNKLKLGKVYYMYHINYIANDITRKLPDIKVFGKGE